MKYLSFLRNLALRLSKNNTGAAIICALYPRAIAVPRARSPLSGSIIMLSVTNRCQCACAHCGAASYRDPSRRELSRAETLELISRLGVLGAEEVYFLGGEPLMEPDLLDYISSAASHGMRTSLDTNGILLDGAMALALKKAGLGKLRVSLDSPYEEEHDRLRGAPGLYRKVITGIKKCAEAGLDCHISANATQENLRDGRLRGILAIGEELGVRTRILSLIRCGRLSGENGEKLCGEDARLIRELLRPGKVYWELEPVDTPGAPFLCGYSMKKTCYISRSGDVQPCIYMPVTFGNLCDERVEDIASRMWRSSNAFGRAPNGCPTNSRRFDAVFGRALAEGGGKAVPYELRASPNSLAEWNEWADSYRASADLLEAVNDAEILASEDLSGKRLLDAGCGTGRFAAAAAAAGARVTAADLSEAMMKEAGRNLKGLSGVTLFRADIEKEVPAGGPYDIVTAVSLLHHLSHADLAVQNLKKALAPGGKLIIVDQVLHRNLAGVLKFFLNRLFSLGPARCAGLLAGRRGEILRRHLNAEERYSLDDFTRRYAGLLPGARISLRRGIFAYLEWTNGAGA